MQTTLTIANERIRVELKPALIRIVNDGALKRLVWKEPVAHTRQLITEIKAAYHAWSSGELAISDHSLMAEIWGHMLAERAALRLRQLMNTPVTNRFVRFLLERMAVIDCGERRVDSNRFIWDWIAPFRRLLLFLLPIR